MYSTAYSMATLMPEIHCNAPTPFITSPLTCSTIQQAHVIAISARFMNNDKVQILNTSKLRGCGYWIGNMYGWQQKKMGPVPEMRINLSIMKKVHGVSSKSLPLKTYSLAQRLEALHYLH